MKKIIIALLILLFPLNIMAYGVKNFTTPTPSPSPTPSPTPSPSPSPGTGSGSTQGNKPISSQTTGNISNPSKENLSVKKFQCKYMITSGYELIAEFTIDSNITVNYRFENRILPEGSTENFIPQHGSKISINYVINRSTYTCPTLSWKKTVYTDGTIHYDLTLNQFSVTAPSTSDDYPVLGCKYKAVGNMGCAIDVVYIAKSGKIEFRKWACGKKMNTSNVCAEAFKNNTCPEMTIKQGDKEIEFIIPSCVINVPGKENDRYSDVETCTDVDVNHIKACGCIPAEVADITSKVYFILRLIGPIILLVIGGFEMAKAIAAQDESAIEKAKKKLVNKFIAAAAIFLVLTIIKLAVSLVADDISGVYKCIDILLDGYVI